jgi:uncharacterized damage-inducible protein DinB
MKETPHHAADSKDVRSIDAGMSKPEIIAAAQDVLQQGLELLSDLGDDSYSLVAGPPFGTSIGQHYRHVLEHFQCFIDGLEGGEINYDARRRDRRLETEVQPASTTTCEVLQALEQFTAQELTQKCKATTSLGYNSAATTIDSNAARELAYCIGHAVHHYAIIRIVANGIGVNISSEFGFAPSTLKHKAAHAAD